MERKNRKNYVTINVYYKGTVFGRDFFKHFFDCILFWGIQVYFYLI